MDHPLLTRSLHSGIKFGLHTIQTVLQALGSPQKKYPSIHIAGTNGKGSTSRFLSCALQALGLKTGLFTSPHIRSVLERFQVNNQNIAADDLKKALDRIQHLCTHLIQTQQIETITFFEACTAAAFLYFSEQNVDAAVIEVGMGGRLDSTNVIDSPWVLLTAIGLDHEEYLGHSLSQVALEKAGIIHGGAQVMLGSMPEEISRLIRRHHPQAHYHLSKKNFSVQSGGAKGNGSNATLIYQSDGPLNGFDFSIPLPGLYQRHNISLALRTLELFCPKRMEGHWVDLRKALSQVSWDGRLHVVSQNPLLIFDAAHNPHGVEALMDSLKILYPATRFSVICGFCKDKDYLQMLSLLSAICDNIRLVPLDVERGALPENILKEISARPFDSAQASRELSRTDRTHPPGASVGESLKSSESFQVALQDIRAETPDKPILVCGSFYLLEKAYAWLEGI